MSSTANVNERLAAVTAAGTSVWLDQIRRSLIQTGELERLVREDSLRGLTSNPAIFEKAILGSPEYDDQISELARDGADARELYRAIAIRDVQEAADVLRPVYDATDGYDGFVSLEVDPDLAHETDKTIAQAREYWAAVDRPNLMIKIPGTDAGVGAIEQAVAEGINVNVTLLFAVEAYEQIAEAYIRGLERRHEAGDSLDVHSVASFFVSRVDTEVDSRLESLDPPDKAALLGTAGLANARAAYVRFKAIFHGERFATLLDAGAPVQRPLWASTGVKNPAYSETMYVDGLLAPETVNTMPMDTLHAAADKAQVDGATADADPTADLDALAAAGIDLADVTDKLLRDGIAKFVTPMEDLLAGIESKREGITTGRPDAVDSTLDAAAEQAVIGRLDTAKADDVVKRIWRKDDTLWGPAGQPEVANRLGWLTIADRMSEEADALEAFTREVLADGYTDVVLLGMGGSSLAPEVIHRSFGTREGFLTFHLLDSTDADAVNAVEAAIDVASTLFLVSTKSGGTVETLSAFEHFHALQGDGAHYVAITDPGSSLVELAREHGFRRTFLNDPDIGGRYSALSYFGLVPAALTGADVRGLLARAAVGRESCDHDSRSNTGLWLGATVGQLALDGRDKLTFLVDAPVRDFGLWVEQLVAESTGKQGRGILPVADEPLGEVDAYGEDRVFVHIANSERPDDDNAAAADALAKAGHPVLTVSIDDDPAELGRLFFVAEFGVAVAGWALGINPFDQPNVQEAKDNTKKVLGGGDLPTVDEADDDALRELLDAGPPHYVATMAYTAPDDALDDAVAGLRAAIRARAQATTTFGYGPRFLHSTGQLHKGGAKTGRFLQLVHDAARDADIPGAGYGFERLKHAQAAGDLQTLADHGLPAVRVTLVGDDVAAAVRALTERVKGL